MTDQIMADAGYHESCSTEFQKVEYKYKWIVRDLPDSFNPRGEVGPLPFTIKGYPISGRIQIQKRHVFTSLEDEVGFPEYEMTVNLETDSTPLLIAVKCSVLDFKGKETLDTCEKHITNITQKKFVLLRRMFDPDWLYNNNNTVTMTFDFTIISNCVSTTNKLQVPKPNGSLAQNFGELLDNPKYSDVTITVGKKKFNVHKIVLAARSSVFAVMFEHKMKEEKSRNIDITDMSEETVSEMLKFIYTDKTEKLEHMTNELLDAAEKYDLRTLKTQCGQCLLRKLNCANAAETLILADRYRLEETKNEVQKFIKDERKLVVGTEGYKAVREKYPHLLLETFE